MVLKVRILVTQLLNILPLLLPKHFQLCLQVPFLRVIRRAHIAEGHRQQLAFRLSTRTSTTCIHSLSHTPARAPSSRPLPLALISTKEHKIPERVWVSCTYCCLLYKTSFFIQIHFVRSVTHYSMFVYRITHNSTPTHPPQDRITVSKVTQARNERTVLCACNQMPACMNEMYARSFLPPNNLLPRRSFIQVERSRSEVSTIVCIVSKCSVRPSAAYAGMRRSWRAGRLPLSLWDF